MPGLSPSQLPALYLQLKRHVGVRGFKACFPTSVLQVASPRLCHAHPFPHSPMAAGFCSFNSGSLETFSLGRSNCLSLFWDFLCPGTRDQEPAGNSRGATGHK